MKKKKIIIIGAGISGLCAGCYLQMNGYDTEIFELHNIPGGLCTAWKRKGYTFDGCIHWLAGSSPGDPFYNLWNELIDLESIEFVDPDRQFRFVSKDGKEMDLYCDIPKLEKELMEKAPEDKAFIKKFIKTIKKLRNFDIPVEKPFAVMSLRDKIKMIFKMLPFMGIILKYGKVSVAELGAKCKNPLLRETFTHNKLFNNFAFLGLVMSLAFFSKKTAGYPIGGSLPFVRLFEKRYTSLGGKIHFSSKVTRIRVENDTAGGVELENGEIHRSDIVISAADGYYTIYEMLQGKYTDKKIENRYQGIDKLFTPFPSLVYVSLGISRKIDNLPHQVIYQIEKPIVVDDTMEHATVNTTIYNFDPTLAEEGKTCVNVMFESFGHEYWTNLRENNIKKYKEEKQRIADSVIDVLEEKIGDIKQNVEVIDVATPATFIRYTNNWRGSYEGWLPVPGALTNTIDKELPGLKKFYMIGQWVESTGGLPPAIKSGRDITQIICKKDRKRFITKQ
jgi:phytoene dehydrogenase-like protein